MLTLKNLQLFEKYILLNLKSINFLSDYKTKNGEDADDVPQYITWSLYFILGGISTFFIYKNPVNIIIILTGFISFSYAISNWISDAADRFDDGNEDYNYTITLKLVIFFIISGECMFFFPFFWSFFNSAWGVSYTLDAGWPTYTTEIVCFYKKPLLNTLLLLFSGFTLTSAMRYFFCRNFYKTKINLILTLILGSLFMVIQGLEYYTSEFSIKSGIYGTNFFALTGLHGFHVLIGIYSIATLYNRINTNNIITPQTHISFFGVVAYWHMVDIIWILLFINVYVLF